MTGRETHGTRSYYEAREVLYKFEMDIDTENSGLHGQTDEYATQKE